MLAIQQQLLPVLQLRPRIQQVLQQHNQPQPRLLLRLPLQDPQPRHQLQVLQPPLDRQFLLRPRHH